MQQQQIRSLGSRQPTESAHTALKASMKATAEYLPSSKKQQCSIANAFQQARCPHCTIRDFIAMVKLKIINATEYKLVTHDHTGSEKQLEQACRKHLQHCLPMMTAMRRERKLISLTFDPRFSEQEYHPAHNKKWLLWEAPTLQKRMNQQIKQFLTNKDFLNRVSKARHLGYWELEKLFNKADK